MLARGGAEGAVQYDGGSRALHWATVGLVLLAMGLTAVHRWMGWSLAGLIGLHLAGALWHGLLRRDGVLGRMLQAWKSRRPGARMGGGAPAFRAGWAGPVTSARAP